MAEELYKLYQDKGYPFEMNDKEIKEIIAILKRELPKISSTLSVSNLTEIKDKKYMLNKKQTYLITREGYEELNLRKALNISKDSLKIAERAKSISRWTLFFSIIATLLALTAVGFSIADYSGDKAWQQEQITLLEQIKDNTNE